MKKKKISKKLDLRKKQISKLGEVTGGAPALSNISCTINPSQLVRTCTWHSELYTACNCEPSWDGNCGPSIDRPCLNTQQPGCYASVFVCDE